MVRLNVGFKYLASRKETPEYFGRANEVIKKCTAALKDLKKDICESNATKEKIVRYIEKLNNDLEGYNTRVSEFCL